MKNTLISFHIMEQRREDKTQEKTMLIAMNNEKIKKKEKNYAYSNEQCRRDEYLENGNGRSNRSTVIYKT